MEEKGSTENEMVGWHHQHNGQEFEQTMRDSEGQGNLQSFCPYGHKEQDMAQQLNNDNNRKPRKIPPDNWASLCQLTLLKETDFRNN